MTLTPQQPQARARGLGGSDIAAVLGLSRYRTPYDAWPEKTGQAVQESGENEPAYWGQVLEDVTAREYSKRTGRRVQRVTATLTHPNYPWALAHIDRAILIPGRRAIWRGDHLESGQAFEAHRLAGPGQASWGGRCADFRIHHRKAGKPRLFKYLPVSVELARAVTLDEAVERGEQGSVIDSDCVIEPDTEAETGNGGESTA